MTDIEKLAASCFEIRSRNPLVHCITNYVAMEFNADALLAVGASPLMSFFKDELPELSVAADSLVVNIGCLDRVQAEAMAAAASLMHTAGKPWVLDPVGAGATSPRTNTALGLIKDFHPSVIRGNASEIMSLARALGFNEGPEGHTKGVDSSIASLEAVGAAERLAKTCGSVVCVSGKVDIVTDGSKTVRIEGGDWLMSRVTAMGCTASALVGAFLAVCDSAFDAAWCAMTLMARAGEKAASMSEGPASLRMNFIDALYNFGK